MVQLSGVYFHASGFGAVLNIKSIGCLLYTSDAADDMHVSARRAASKEGYQDTFRTKCSFRDKSTSFRAWDLEEKKPIHVDELKTLDWANSRMACVVQLSGVYFQASGFGAVLNIKSMGLRAASAECPFAFVDAGE